MALKMSRKAYAIIAVVFYREIHFDIGVPHDCY